jgi:antitoxin HicB
MKHDAQRSVDYYMALPYTFELIPDHEGDWFVAVKELPGCMSEGQSPEDAMAMIRDAMRGWIELALEDGEGIPEPRDAESYSGKFVVRVPRSLHGDLARMAEGQGASLNQLVNVALATYVARHLGNQPAQPALQTEHGATRREETTGARSGRWVATAGATPAASAVGDERPRWSQTTRSQRPRRVRT